MTELQGTNITFHKDGSISLNGVLLTADGTLIF